MTSIPLNPGRPGPLQGLVLLAVVTLLSGLLCPAIPNSYSGSGNVFPSTRGACVYKIVHDGVVIGTIFLDEPKRLSEILEAVGCVDRPRPKPPHAEIPCGSEVRLMGDPPLARIAPMSGGNLICAGQRIDLNLASESDLVAIRGIGPHLAGRIVQQRHSQGRYSSVKDLQRVPGIGAKKYSAIAQFVQVNPAWTRPPVSRRPAPHRSP